MPAPTNHEARPDTVDRIAAALANLDAYIDRKAAEKAAPAIAEAVRAAGEAIRAAQADVQRQQDLVAELRRRIDAMDKREAQAMEARTRIAAALGVLPHTMPWSALAAEAERHLAEQAAEIERLRLQILDGIKNEQMDEVPLPEDKGARDG